MLMWDLVVWVWVCAYECARERGGQSLKDVGVKFGVHRYILGVYVYSSVGMKVEAGGETPKRVMVSIMAVCVHGESL